MYIGVLFIDCLWGFIFFNAYLRGGKVHGFFFIFMFAIWYIFNLFCALFLEDRVDYKGYSEKEPLNMQESSIKRGAMFIIPKLKYLFIGLVNALVIGLVIRSWINNGSFEWLALILLLIFDLFNLYLIVRTKNIKSKEFYRLLLIVAPLIIFGVWMLIA